MHAKSVNHCRTACPRPHTFTYINMYACMLLHVDD